MGLRSSALRYSSDGVVGHAELAHRGGQVVVRLDELGVALHRLAEDDAGEAQGVVAELVALGEGDRAGLVEQAARSRRSGDLRQAIGGPDGVTALDLREDGGEVERRGAHRAEVEHSRRFGRTRRWLRYYRLRRPRAPRAGGCRWRASSGRAKVKSSATSSKSAVLGVGAHPVAAVDRPRDLGDAREGIRRRARRGEALADREPRAPAASGCRRGTASETRRR